MGIIHELDTSLVNKIAAGEVIESSFSVVKELVENSLDALSTQIEVETVHGGIDKIVVSDNGLGIDEDDIELAFRRHATSKIQNLNDLEAIQTFGFRGEALSSIASVSKICLTTGKKEGIESIQVKSEKGIISSRKMVSGRKGTTIEVSDLFFNTPVRRKFIKSEKSEDKKIKDKIISAALSRHDVSFRFIQDGKEIFRLSPEDRKERIISVFGENFRDHLLEVNSEKNGISVTGFISDPDFYRSNRMGQYTFVNGRAVEIKYASFLLKKSYDELLPGGAHPWCFLFFEIDPSRVDVNVHPAKKELRFLDEDAFHSIFLYSIGSVLRSKTPVSFLELKKRLQTPLKFERSEVDTSSGSGQIAFGDSFQPKPVLQKGFELENVGHGRYEENFSVEKKRTEFIPKRHFGLLFDTFILAEGHDGLYIIDQHTAHERIRYEEILRKFTENISTQSLLTPIRLDLSIIEAEEVVEKGAELESVGFRLDDLGGGTVLVREVPDFIDSGSEKEIILDFLNKTKDLSEEKQLFDELAKSIACRHAIKKGDQLSDHLIGEILNRLSYCENPSRCPHGRPTLVKLTRDDLERMFHRK